MTIQILSPQLANQIAAGEVVERPASVIKELVENSIDAGATQINIDIEQGGIRLLSVRDNGTGIPKQELGLSLARHATSKIVCLEDLTAIRSLGFRGEALASISSVSRLKLTSRTADQAEAWQVYAEGQEMQTAIVPAAHPVGSTVEVADLFYNTPARRRFLKTEKTEFTHIDDTLKKIALAYPAVAFQIVHNGKRIRQYRPAQNDEQLMRRLMTICGTDFVSGALKLDWRHDDFYIHGWINPKAEKDISYFYVNQRVVRDRLLSHAIKHAFEPVQSGIKPAYVVYLELNPENVDVNVHPTKHEVRFHESRLVHDFVYQALRMAITAEAVSEHEPVPEANRIAAGENIFAKMHFASVQEKKSPVYSKTSRSDRPTSKVLSHYRGLVIPKNTDIQENSALLFPTCTTPLAEHSIKRTQVQLGKVVALWLDNYAILQGKCHLQLVSLEKAEQILYSCRLQEQTTKAAEKLLIPLKLALKKDELQCWKTNAETFSSINVVFQVEGNTLQLQAVPTLLRTLNWQHIVSQLTAYMMGMANKNVFTQATLVTWFAAHYCQWIHLTHRQSRWTQVQAVALMTQLEQTKLTSAERDVFIEPIDLSGPLTALQSK